MLDSNKLKYYAAKNNKSLADIAAKMSINPATLSRKLRGSTEFSRKEMEICKDYLSLTNEEAMSIFFAD